MSSFLKALNSGDVLLMDGAMGTQLQRAGGRDGDCFELWNLTRPETIRAVHAAYVAAGADVLLTNTFQAHPAWLARHGCAEQLEAIFQAALANARAAAGADRFVLADIGPVEHIDNSTASRLVGAAQGADGLFLETWSDPNGVKAFADALESRAEVPISLLISFTYWRANPEAPLTTFAGFSPEVCAKGAMAARAAALGINCGQDLTLSDFVEAIRRYQSVTDLPIVTRPNAGTPVRVGNGWEYPRTPEMLAGWIPELLEAGVSMVGGCCGTAPEHIASFRAAIERGNC